MERDRMSRWLLSRTVCLSLDVVQLWRDAVRRAGLPICFCLTRGIFVSTALLSHSQRGRTFFRNGHLLTPQQCVMHERLNPQPFYSVNTFWCWTGNLFKLSSSLCCSWWLCWKLLRDGLLPAISVPCRALLFVCSTHLTIRIQSPTGFSYIRQPISADTPNMIWTGLSQH